MIIKNKCPVCYSEEQEIYGFYINQTTIIETPFGKGLVLNHESEVSFLVICENCGVAYKPKKKISGIVK